MNMRLLLLARRLVVVLGVAALASLAGARGPDANGNEICVGSMGEVVCVPPS